MNTQSQSETPSVFASIRSAFLTGLLLLAPLAVTVIAFSWLLGQVGGSFKNFFFFWVPDGWLDDQRLKLLWDFLATVIVIGLITFFGFISSWFLSRFFGAVMERFIQRIPGVGAVYNTVKQIVATFGSQNRALFSKVVLIEFPRTGVWSIGFQTNKSQGELLKHTGQDAVAVFVPTSPNPTSGFLMFVPKSQVIELEMSAGDAMKLIISGGAVLPPWPAKAKTDTTLPAKAAE